MKNQFAQNIKKLRKQNNLTQEQLADAMNVTIGAVYKWEQGLSIPDISVIMDIANYFKLSVDALIGFNLEGNDKADILETLNDIKLHKDYLNCEATVENGLKRFPNDFDIVYNSGILYGVFGHENHDLHFLKRSIELLKYSEKLFNQNIDKDISLTSINREIAISYLQSGEVEIGIKYLEIDNPCGVNDNLLGYNYSFDPDKKAIAKGFLAKSLMKQVDDLYDVAMGLNNLLDEEEGIEVLKWYLNFLDGLRIEHKPSFLDKDYVAILTMIAVKENRLNRFKDAQMHMKEANAIAREFDENPDYTTTNIKYCDELKNVVSYDDGGTSAIETIENILKAERR